MDVRRSRRGDCDLSQASEFGRCEALEKCRHFGVHSSRSSTQPPSQAQPNPEIALSHFGRRASSPRWHFLPSTNRPRPASEPPSISTLSLLHQTLSTRLSILSFPQQRAHQVVIVAQHVVTHRKGRSALQTLHRTQKIRRRHSNRQQHRNSRLFHSALAFWLSTAVHFDIGCCHSARFVRCASSQGATHHPTTQCARHSIPDRRRQWSIQASHNSKVAKLRIHGAVFGHWQDAKLSCHAHQHHRRTAIDQHSRRHRRQTRLSQTVRVQTASGIAHLAHASPGFLSAFFDQGDPVIGPRSAPYRRRGCCRSDRSNHVIRSFQCTAQHWGLPYLATRRRQCHPRRYKPRRCVGPVRQPPSRGGQGLTA